MPRAVTPAFFFNPSGAASAFIANNNVLPGGWAGFHPGPSGETSDFRFTAPSAGRYSFAFSFEGADTVGTNTDVHIYTRGQDLFSATINGFGPASLQTFSGTVSLATGQVVDIGVGFATNQNYLFDLTAVQGTIAAVPEVSARPIGEARRPWRA